MESTPEQAAEGLAIIKVLATVLERLVCANTALARTDPGQVTKFHALKAPGIGILAYLERIHKYASCSNECFILALIYIDRLIQRNNFLLTELNVHRVVITAILLAAKFFDDAYYNNAYYSKVGGVLVSEMNGLEVDFLFRINFSLHVSPELFEKYKAELVAHSINAGLAITHPPSPPQTHLPDLVMVGAGLEQNLAHAQAPATLPIQLQAACTIPQQVTPSPSHTHAHTHAHPQTHTHPVPHNVPVPAVAPVAAPVPVAVESRIVDANAIGQQLYVADQLLPNGVTQQFLQRANSLPPFPSHPSRCLANNPPYSAPMVSMLPTGVDEQYMIVSGNQIFPLQTTLVHHHHGVDNYHNQAPFHHHQAHGGAGYAIARETIGSLVAGHY